MRLAHTPLLALALVSLAAPPARAQSPLKLNEFVAGPARDWDGSGARSEDLVSVAESTNTFGTTGVATRFVGAPFTCCERTADVLARKFPSPPYAALSAWVPPWSVLVARLARKHKPSRAVET